MVKHESAFFVQAQAGYLRVNGVLVEPESGDLSISVLQPDVVVVDIGPRWLHMFFVTVHKGHVLKHHIAEFYFPLLFYSRILCGWYKIIKQELVVEGCVTGISYQL